MIMYFPSRTMTQSVRVSDRIGLTPIFSAIPLQIDHSWCTLMPGVNRASEVSGDSRSHFFVSRLTKIPCATLAALLLGRRPAPTALHLTALRQSNGQQQERGWKKPWSTGSQIRLMHSLFLMSWLIQRVLILRVQALEIFSSAVDMLLSIQTILELMQSLEFCKTRIFWSEKMSYLKFWECLNARMDKNWLNWSLGSQGYGTDISKRSRTEN